MPFEAISLAEIPGKYLQEPVIDPALLPPMVQCQDFIEE
jgi:hypothetical protein